MSRLISLLCVLVVALFASDVILAEEKHILKCNLCLGSLESDCAKNISSASIVEDCILRKTNDTGSTTTAIPVETTTESDKRQDKFFCVSFETKDPFVSAAYITRGCLILKEYLKPCEFLKSKLPGVENCKTCEEDGCN